MRSSSIHPLILSSRPLHLASLFSTGSVASAVLMKMEEMTEKGSRRKRPLMEELILGVMMETRACVRAKSSREVSITETRAGISIFEEIVDEHRVGGGQDRR